MLSAVGAAFLIGSLSLWVPVVTTIGVSVTAHVAAARYDPLVVEYLATAQRLDHLRQDHLADRLAGAELVEAAEDAVAAENQAWLARWNRSDTG